MAEPRVRIETPRGTVSGAVTGGPGRPILVVAPGAGAGYDMPLLAGIAEGLDAGGVTCLRFNFLHRERGRKAPDREPVLREAWLAAFEHARAHAGGPVWAGGKSLGGRIASLCAADGMPAAGLVFFGYPLHPPGKPERIRDAHLPRIEVPILWIQGTRDPFARRDLLERTLEGLGKRATLHEVDGGDHSFRVRGRRRPDPELGHELGQIAATFVLERS